MTGLTPSLTISSAAQPNHPTDAYTSEETRLIAPMDSFIPTITIKHDPHSRLDVGSLPEGLKYSYDQATHTGTITGTPNKLLKRGFVDNIIVESGLEAELLKKDVSGHIWKRIYIEVVPEKSGLEITSAEQRFNADQEMTPITVSGFDNRATIELDGAPEGVSYNTVTHQITGTPTSGVGDYSFNVRARMPESTGGEVTTKGVTLHVLPIEPSLSANPNPVTVEATHRMPDITITKDSLSELAVPTVTIGGTGNPRPLSELGLSYDTTSRMITGTPTVVGNHTIHLSTTLSKRYTGVDGGVTKTLEIPVTVNAKSFELTINHQTQTKTVLSPIDSVALTVPDGINLTVDTDKLPPGVTYNAESKTIEGTPSKVGTYNVTVTARPEGITGNDKTATVTIQVNPLEATIGITNREQNVQVGTEMTEVTVRPNEHASVFGTDLLLNAVSGNASGITESNVVNYFLGAYGLTYNPTNHTITGIPTKTGRIVFTFIARNSDDLGGAEARETVVLNVVESLSKIPVITEAQEGSNVVKGSGVAGSTVTVTLPDGAVKTAEVATDGTWMVETTTPLVKGQNISARQKEVNKTESNDISATVVGNSGLVPSKEALVNAIVEGATTVTGKGENGSTITVTRPDGTVKIATVSEGTWSVTLDTAAVKGENILVTQTEANKATSPAVTATVVPKITKGDQGEQGNPGTNGRDGFTPEVSVTPNDDGSYTITITQPGGKEPIKTTVKNGTNGTNGTNGRDGRTPKVLLTPIYENPAHPRTRRTRSVDNRAEQPTGKQIGVHITVYFDNNNSGTYDEGDELVSEKDIYDGVDGRDGANGTDGAAGRDGRDGKDILNGTETPGENQGKDGDTFVNTKTGEVFVKENGTWKPAGNIKGPKGDKGENGTNGTNGAAGANGTDGAAGRDGRDGKDILNGTETPGENQGKDGDTFVNTKTGEVFVKENGTWKPAGNIKGPKGDKGENGTNGTNGAAGANGTDGAAGRDGRDGKDGVDGKSPTVSVRENGDGSHTIVITNPNGNIIETTVRDGKSPTVSVRENKNGTHTITIENADGKTTTTTVRDGKDGQSPTVSVRNNNDGTHTVTIINPDGSKTEAVIKDGKDGKDGQSPTASVTNNGDGTHTITITNSDGKVTTTVIKDGKCGCNDKPGGHTPGNPTNPKQENPTNPGGPTFEMPEPPVHEKTEFNGAVPGMPEVYDKPEFNGRVPGMPAVHEKPEYPGIPTNPNSDETTPGTPTPGTLTNPNPGVTTPETSMNPNPGVPTSEGTTNPDSGVPTSGGSTSPNSAVSTAEELTKSNPGVSSAVNKHPSGELPKTGTKAEYLPMLLASGALLTLYIGRRKEEEE